MLRQIVAVILLSVLVIFLLHPLHNFLYFIDEFHALLVQVMGNIFAGGKLGYWLRHVIALCLPAFFLAAVVELIMRIFKQEGTRYASYIMWISWAVLVVLVGLR
jgi:hypothetical protein